MSRLLKITFGVVAVLLAAAALWGFLAQSAPDPALAVNGGSPRCDPSGVWVAADRSGPLPTRLCRYPPDLP